MDKLQAIFKTEAEELLSDLERAVLDFENDLSSMESVREIFRVMHTLKGTASMFGFETLSAFTHDLETIFDDIRNGKSKASADILEITLESVDHIKNLISDPQLKNAQNEELHNSLLARIGFALLHPHTGQNIAIHPVESSNISTYYIYFKPSYDIFKNGTNPLYLVDDLTRLGQAHVIPTFSEVPDLASIQMADCYTAFEILLATKENEDTVREVFLFVEDSSEITIKKIADENIIARRELIASFDGVRFEKPAKPIYGVEGILTLLNKREPATEKKAVIQKEKKEGSTIRVASEKLDELMNLVSELVTSQARLNLLSQQHQLADLMGVSETMEKLTRRLRDNAFTICLIPIESLVIRFQRLVRDLAKDLDKEIDFVTEGTETELDRSVIERVTDPILHILRNCIDHGMESPEERQNAGKKSRGTIWLKAYHSGTNVVIEIGDDGRGIDPKKIREKAIERGLIQADQQLSQNELLNLIFAAGFSTAAQVTDVSGRGVGMDIVKRNIEGIHGEVQVSSTVGQGTVITIRLPLTLSILDGMLVKIGESHYVLPLSMIQTCHEIESKKLTEDVAQKHIFNNELLPVFNLYSAFNCKSQRDIVSHVIKVHFQDFPAGIAVDHIVGEYQAVMKPLGEMYKGHDEFSGATILGDGSVALVLDTTTLLRTLIKNELQTVRNN